METPLESTGTGNGRSILPPNWVQYYDEKYHAYYYYNTKTYATQWDKPTMLIKSGSYGDFKQDIKVANDSNVYESEYQQDNDATFDDYHYDYDYEQSWEDYETYKQDDFEANVDESAERDHELMPTIKATERENRAVNVRKRTERQVTVGGKNQDYLGLAAQYKQTRPYSDPNFYAVCVLCNVHEAEDVFFPCEHRCVCRACLQREHIVSESMMKNQVDGHCYCSLCATVIKLILPAECGLEVDKYWDWVYEVPVPLPKGFLKNFKHSAGVIRSVYCDEHGHDDDSNERKSEICSIS